MHVEAPHCRCGQMAVGESITKTLAYAVGDAWSKGSAYSALPVPSYPDSTNVSTLMQPVTYRDDDTSVAVFGNHQRRFVDKGRMF